MLSGSEYVGDNHSFYKKALTRPSGFWNSLWFYYSRFYGWILSFSRRWGWVLSSAFLVIMLPTMMMQMLEMEGLYPKDLP